jgi:hypothetical protein
MPLSRVFQNIASSVVNRQRFDPTVISRSVQKQIDRRANLASNVGSAAGAALGAPIRVGSAAGSGLLSGVQNQFPNNQMPPTMNNSKESRGILDDVGVGGTINFGKNQPVPVAVYLLGGVALVAVGFGIFSRLNQPKRKRK